MSKNATEGDPHHSDRNKMQERLAEILKRGDGGQAAALVLNLDNFRRINDGCGHCVGDAVLLEVAERIRSTVREHDEVCRIGADEFLILMDAVSGRVGAREIGERLRDAIRRPIATGVGSIRTTVSIGLALTHSECGTPDDLIRQATSAMVAVKRRGGDAVGLPTADNQYNATERLLLENDLREALERQEFELYYQPKFSITGAQMVGVEALIRWHHPKRGLVSPGAFIPIAEETGLIVQIGDWVLREALQARARWHSEPRIAVLPTVSINISTKQFERPGFYEVVRDAVERSGCAGHELDLELTETVLMMDSQDVWQTMNRLRALGVGLSMDDFGTGFSSLSLIKRIPLTSLKIDRSFVEGIPASREDSAIITAIVELSRTLGFETIAEGVETEEQRAFLARAGCDTMQGYLMAPPLPEEQFLALLRAQIPGFASPPEPSRQSVMARS